jgi:hypothetical protein
MDWDRFSPLRFQAQKQTQQRKCLRENDGVRYTQTSNSRLLLLLARKEEE